MVGGDTEEGAMADTEDRFRPLDGLPGKLYVPSPRGPRKHPCADCFQCQWCGDSRCTACRGGEGKAKSKRNSNLGQD